MTTEIAPAVNPALRDIAPESLLIASDPALWAGMQRIVQMFGRNLPKGLDQGTAMLLMLAGKEYGLGPIEAISNLFFIGGRIVPSANTMMRLAAGNGLVIKPLRETDEIWEAEFIRPGRESITSSYTIEQAKKAGLLGSDTWKKHPMFMLRARCISATIRMYAGDLVKGIEYSAEEVVNGSGYFDQAGNFTPDESVVGQNPSATDFKEFEGRRSDNQETKRQPVKEAPAAPQAQAPTPEEEDMARKNVDARNSITMLPKGKVIKLATEGGTNSLDFMGTINNIFNALTEATGSADTAKAKAKELMEAAGVKEAREMKGKPSFIQFYLSADEFCAKAASAPTAAPTAKPAAKKAAPKKAAEPKVEPEAPAEAVPAFDPHRGAGTQNAASEVADAAPADDLDAAILSLFNELAEAGKDSEANAVMENTGYTDDQEKAPVSVKKMTIMQLEQLKAS